MTSEWKELGVNDDRDTAGRSSIEQLLAYEQIRQLASRYAVTLNHRDLDALAALFVSDVRVGRDTFGRRALRDDFANQLRPLGRTVLQVTNHVIDLDETDADQATGIVGCRGEIEVDGVWIVQVIEYHDSYRRESGQWRFVRRRHLLWYGAPSATTPVGMPPANWPANHTGQGDLPDRLPSWQRWIAEQATPDAVVD